MKSPAQLFVDELARGASDPHAALDALLDALSPLEASTLWHSWEHFWARPEQLPPEGAWSSWGQLTGKGWGKNRANAEAITLEVIEGRARCVGLMGQTEDRTRDMMVLDPDCGLVAVSPPWFRAKLKLGRVEWPNGALAYLYSPESVGAIHGHSHDLFWASEIHVWPTSTMLAAWATIDLGVRKGAARLIWDSNPCPRHPIIGELLDRAIKRPARHRVTRGTVYENADNINRAKLEDWIDKWGGTAYGRRMLEGVQEDESEGALFKQAWIERVRRDSPTDVQARAIAIDPAISTRPGTDATGIVQASRDASGQIYVERDLSGRHAADAWARMVIDAYFEGRCNVIVAERNRGGDLVVHTIRAIAREPEMVARYGAIRVESVKLDAPTRHVRGVIYVKEVHSRDDKETRALPTTPLYERGQVSHALEGLDELETELTTFVPAPKVASPNRFDACVFVVTELAGLWSETRTGSSRADVRAAVAASRLVRPAPASALSALAAVYRYGQGRRL